MNTRSLLPKFHLIEEDFLDGSIDIICLTETWLKQGIPESNVCNVRACVCNVKFNLIRYDRTVNNPVTGVRKTARGIVVYLKKGITYEFLENESICTDDIEMCVIRLAAGGNKKQIFLGVYRPPAGNVVRALEALTNCLEKFNARYQRTKYVVLGDLNINYLDKKCSQVKLLKTLEKQLGLTQVISEATRVTLDKSTLIDLCLTNMNNLSHSGVIHYFLSDHFPIFVVKKKLKLEKKCCNFIGRSYLNYSLEVFKSELDRINWTDILNENNPDNIWNQVMSVLMSIADTICPTKEFNITRQRPLYFNTELVEHIKERDAVLRLATRKNDKN